MALHAMGEKPLAGRIAVVTGASSGIGEKIAIALARNGAKVALGARREDRLQALKHAIESEGGAAIAVVTDVTKRDDVKRLVAETEKAFGPVDILVNNAGVMLLTMMKNVREDDWDRMIDVNVKGVLHGIGAVLKGFIERKRGDIINISSDAGRKVFPSGAIYCASKWAVEAITQGLRLELANTGVRFTSIQPGATYSELATHILDDDEIIKRNGAAFASMRLLDANDVADAVIYAVTRPAHAAINEILIRPTAQSS